MLDEGGFDYGVLTGIGLVIAAAVVILFIFALFRSAAPANTAIALETASGEVSGDIGAVSAMAVPYTAERYYGFDDIGVSVSADHVTASIGNDTFYRPLTTRIVPGKYVENGSLLWNGTAGVIEYLNCTFNATGSRGDPIDVNDSDRLRSLMKMASQSTLMEPIEVPRNKPLLIEKMLIYTMNNSSRALEAEPYVFVYPG